MPWRFNESDERCLAMKKHLREEIIKSIKQGYIYFISGMALGFDMIAAEMVLELKKQYPNIKLVCALSCNNQDAKWPIKQKERYKTILDQADIIRYLSEEYTDTCMLERNDYMINNSSRCIALYDGKSGGGTQHTILYAKNKDIEIIIIKP